MKPDGAAEKLDYVGKAITLTRHRLEGKVPLFGFSGAPVSKCFMHAFRNNCSLKWMESLLLIYVFYLTLTVIIFSGR